MKILVTGGSGYIGSHAVHELVGRKHEVVVLDTLELGHRELAERAGASKLIVGSTGDVALLEEVFDRERPEAVMHFAGYKAPGESVEDPAKYFGNNVANTLPLLDAMVKHHTALFIFSSSCSIFGTPEVVPVTEDNNPTRPESPYGESKLTVERMLRWYGPAYGIKCVSLRYFNAAGASLDGQLGEDWGMTLNLIPLVLKAALGQSPSVQIFGTDYPTPDGTCIRDYAHVVDLATAHALALEYVANDGESTAYNLGTGRGSSVREVVDLTRRISGNDFRVIETARRPGDPAAIWADNSKAKRELGWIPQHGLDEIIGSAYRWHKSHPSGY